MSDQIRAPSAVNRVQPLAADEGRPFSFAGANTAVDNAAVKAADKAAANAAAAKAADKTAAPAATSAPNAPDGKPPVENKPEAKPAPSPEVFRNVQLHFRIDPDTHDITVLMVDSASRRVIRAIPPEELDKLSQGDLVEMLA